MCYYSEDACLEIFWDYAKKKEVQVGTKLPADGKLAVYRGDSREHMEDKGFEPSSILDKGEDFITHARKQADGILRRAASEKDVLQFVMAWKYPNSTNDPLIKGAGGRMAGVCCGVTGGQKGGYTYRITVPSLYLLEKKKGSSKSAIVIYGDQPSLDNCNTIAMHLPIGNDAAEFAFLTPVPPEWIEKVD